MTLRELLEMAEWHRREAWDHTAAQLALLANCHRDPKIRRKPFQSVDFHPFHVKPVRKGLPIGSMSIRSLAKSLGVKGI